MDEFQFKLPSRSTHNKDCSQCGRNFLGKEHDETCRDCRFYADHPELAPKYWTWSRGPQNSWKVACTWPEKETFPEPGLRIEVHRKGRLNLPGDRQGVRLPLLRHHREPQGRLPSRVKSKAGRHHNADTNEVR